MILSLNMDLEGQNSFGLKFWGCLGVVEIWVSFEFFDEFMCFSVEFEFLGHQNLGIMAAGGGRRLGQGCFWVC